MWTTGTLRTVRTWVGLSTAALGTLVLVVPFLLPYQEAARLFHIERPFGEVVSFSANALSYLTASENLSVWGGLLRLSPRPEGETFLGVLPWMLAAAALASAARATSSWRQDAARLRWPIVVLAILAAAQFVSLLAVVMLGGFDVNLFGVEIRARTPMRTIFQFVAVAGLLLALSSRLRERALQLARSPVALCLALTVLAMWLSFGPMPSTGDGRASGFGIYRALYDHVPGFDGLRVPARYAMIAGLFLAVAAGYGARLLIFNFEFLIAVAVLVLAEGAAIPMELNRTWGMNQATPPPRVVPAAQAAPVYARVKALPAGTVITEFPFGDGAWEIRYVFFAAAHWKPITNGYSGAFPPSYRQRVARLSRIAADPDAAWQTLLDSRTTHAIVHRSAFARPEDAAAVEAWLTSRGASIVERFPDGDILFSVTSN
jgi:hypothetical protein